MATARERRNADMVVLAILIVIGILLCMGVYWLFNVVAHHLGVWPTFGVCCIPAVIITVLLLSAAPWEASGAPNFLLTLIGCVAALMACGAVVYFIGWIPFKLFHWTV